MRAEEYKSVAGGVAGGNSVQSGVVASVWARQGMGRFLLRYFWKLLFIFLVCFVFTPSILAEGRNPLCSSFRVNLEDMERFIREGADVNGKCRIGDAPPIFSYINPDKSPAFVDLLISHGADVNALNRFYHTPLLRSALSGNIGIMKDLIAAGAYVDYPHPFPKEISHRPWKVDHKEMGTPLLWSVYRYDDDNTDALELLLEHGANIYYSRDNSGLTVLHHVILFHFHPQKILSYIIQNGFQDRLNQRRRITGTTPLIDAISSARNPFAATKTLICAGADVNLKDSNKNGRTPLMYAFIRGNLSIAMFLIKHGADLNIIDNEGLSGYYYMNKIVEGNFFLKNLKNEEATCH